MDEIRPDQASDPAPKEKADLSRLRIQRSDAGGRTTRGFPLMRILLVAIVVILGLLFRDSILGLFGAGGPQVRTAQALRVVPGQAKAGDVSANGYIVADRQASLATVLSGRLVELDAKEGDIVEKDAAVARIQFDDYEVEVQTVIAKDGSPLAPVSGVGSQLRVTTSLPIVNS